MHKQTLSDTAREGNTLVEGKVKDKGYEQRSRGNTSNLGSNTCKGPELVEAGACSKEERGATAIPGFGPLFATRLTFLFLAPLGCGGAY